MGGAGIQAEEHLSCRYSVPVSSCPSQVLCLGKKTNDIPCGTPTSHVFLEQPEWVSLCPRVGG